MLDFLKGIIFRDNRRSLGRAFYYLWFGETIAMVGSSLCEFAIGIWVYKQTGSVLQFSLVIVFSTLPYIVMLPFAGMIADRFNRFYVMIISDILCALIMIMLILLVAQDSLDLKVFYVINILLATVGALRHPSYEASMSEVLPKERYANASGLLDISDNLVSMLAPTVSGVLVMSIGLMGIICIDLITFCVGTIFILSAFSIVRSKKKYLKVFSKESGVCSSNLTFPMEGLIKNSSGHQLNSSKESSFFVVREFFRQQPLMLRLLCYDVFLSGCIVLVSSLIMPKILLTNSPQDLGIIFSIGSVGGLLGAMTLAYTKTPRDVMSIVLLGGAVSSCCIITMGFDSHFITYCICLFAASFCSIISEGLAQSLWMRKVPLQMQGRVFATVSFVNILTITVFVLLGGIFVEKFIEPSLSNGSALSTWLKTWIGQVGDHGIGVMFVLCGAVGLILSLTPLLTRFRQLDLIVPDADADEDIEDELEEA